jgi:hypothetical protein
MTENIGHRKWSKKMLSLGGPTLKKDDLGCANHYKHKIELNKTNAVYVKQFQIAEAYCEGLFDQVKSWLILEIIKPLQSNFNSPIFVVTKKSGKSRCP